MPLLPRLVHGLQMFDISRELIWNYIYIFVNFPYQIFIDIWKKKKISKFISRSIFSMACFYIDNCVIYHFFLYGNTNINYVVTLILELLKQPQKKCFSFVRSWRQLKSMSNVLQTICPTNNCSTNAVFSPYNYFTVFFFIICKQSRLHSGPSL